MPDPSRESIEALGLLADDDALCDDDARKPVAKPWKILIADDDEEIHLVSRMVLRDFTFEGRGVVTHSAHSGQETKDLVAAHPDAAVLLLDVVMENEHAGLEAIRYIRETLKHMSLRIILRTGQPGQAPEKSVVIDYDINDYKDKSELTAQKLTTALISALRAYRDIEIINNGRLGLERVIAASRTLYEPQSLVQFANAVLGHLLTLLDLGDTGAYIRPIGVAVTRDTDTADDFIIAAAVGECSDDIGHPVGHSYIAHIAPLIAEAARNRRSVIGPRDYIGYFRAAEGAESLIYIEGQSQLSSMAIHLLEVFSSNIEAAYNNIHLNLLLQHQASHDPLTGLGNRTMLHDRLTVAIAQARRTNQMMALLFIDLDNFKYINNSLGHGAGDAILREISARIATAIRASDTATRLGGDEFVILLHAPDNQAAVADVVERLRADISQPITVENQNIIIGCSIGIAMFPQDGNSPEELIRKADIAMYGAKEMGRATFQFFIPEFNDRIKERMELERDLHHALDRDELRLHYQPLINLETGQIVGAEALLRWNHPKIGLISPTKFIPIAEECGLILPISQRVMDIAGSDVGQWLTGGEGGEFRLCLNLSPRQFRGASLFADVERLLGKLDLGKLSLELEVTEGMVMGNPAEAARIMTRLKEIGVKLSMDDFGTGYSSLAYLRTFPFDTIKIDRSFTDGLGKGSGSEAIVRSIVALANSFGMSLIAEGVETEEQVRHLIDEACLVVQGFLFSRPLPQADFVARLAQ